MASYDAIMKFKINIKIPTERQKGFSISFGGTPRIRKTATQVYRWAERKIMGFYAESSLVGKAKTAVLVEYGHGYRNEAEASNPKEILYILACFLEDYLPKPTLERKYKKYLSE